MQELKQYRPCDNFIVVGIVDDGRVLGFTITDHHLERATERNFETASIAYQWGVDNYKGLL